MHKTEEKACFPLAEPHVRFASVRSSGSLPYDERHAYCSGQTQFLNNNRPRRRTKHTSISPYAKRRSSTTQSHHRPQNAGIPFDTPPPLSLMAIGSAMMNILSIYLKHNSIALQKSCRKNRKLLLLSFGALCLFLLLWLSVLLVGFHIDATRLCTPPPDYDPFERPLVEYFIHGRGNGHYARSMAVIESLNDVGIDVRMFIGRAPIWNFFHSAKPLLGGKKGQTTAIAVTSLQPMPVLPTISHVMERIMGDCEVALQTNRYPLLVISDGDAPGMLRAYYGSIPSLAISHGQIFSIGIKPDWVLEDKRLNEAWDKQGRLNRNAALFSRWQIGTDFGYLEPKQPSAIVARPPFRPEVLQMAVARKHVVDGGQLIVEEHEIAQRMANLVLHGTEYVAAKETYNVSITSSHRKLVLCYFRDHNGEIIIDALLQAGFDVLFFETSYNKKFGTDDPNRFGTRWIVKEEDRVKLREAAQFGGATLESHTTEHHKKEPHRRLSERWRRDSASPRLIRVTDRALFVAFMSIADGIVASAGSQLISECIYANVPLLALYRMDDDEQVLNVEMSRQERVMRRKIPVYGAAFENFHAAYPTKYSYVRRSNHTPTPPKLQSSGANVARSEFESFVDKVDESLVSDAYFQFLKNPGNVTTMLHSEVQNIPLSDRADDPFHGMPDATAIILEVIKQVQKEADEG